MFVLQACKIITLNGIKGFVQFEGREWRAQEGQDMYFFFSPLTASPYLPKEKELQKTFHPPIHSGTKLEGTSEKWEKSFPFLLSSLSLHILHERRWVIWESSGTLKLSCIMLSKDSDYGRVNVLYPLCMRTVSHPSTILKNYLVLKIKYKSLNFIFKTAWLKRPCRRRLR